MPHLSRVIVAYGGKIHAYAERPDFSPFDEAHGAVLAHDPGTIAGVFAEWAPFWCDACRNCYCAEHWVGPGARAWDPDEPAASGPRLCPRGHAWPHPLRAT